MNAYFFVFILCSVDENLQILKGGLLHMNFFDGFASGSGCGCGGGGCGCNTLWLLLLLCCCGNGANLCDLLPLLLILCCCGGGNKGRDCSCNSGCN